MCCYLLAAISLIFTLCASFLSFFLSCLLALLSLHCIALHCVVVCLCVPKAPEVKERDPKGDRKVCIYGYVRGTHLKPNMRVHVIGCGDHSMASITLLEDPCPLPDQMKGQRHKLNDREYA